MKSHKVFQLFNFHSRNPGQIHDFELGPQEKSKISTSCQSFVLNVVFNLEFRLRGNISRNNSKIEKKAVNDYKAQFVYDHRLNTFAFIHVGS